MIELIEPVIIANEVTPDSNVSISRYIFITTNVDMAGTVNTNKYTHSGMVPLDSSSTYSSIIRCASSSDTSDI